MRQINPPTMNRSLNALNLLAIDQPGINEAQRRYVIDGFQTAYNPANRGQQFPAMFSSMSIFFHDGPIFADAPLNGVTPESLLAVIADHLQSKLRTPEGSMEIHMAVDNIMLALNNLSRRNEIRYASTDMLPIAV